jgi:hypothetical protein
MTREAAFTKTDLLGIIVAVVALVWFGYLGLLRLNMTGDKLARASRVKCLTNLKQIGLAYRIYAADHEGRFPSHAVMVSDRATVAVWQHYLPLSNQLNTAKILMCPADRKRMEYLAEDFGEGTNGLAWLSHRNLSISYFVGVQATPGTSSAILAGDRNLSSSKDTLLSSAPDNRPVRVSGKAYWSAGPDTYLHGAAGNVVLADGSTIEASQSKLRKALAAAEKAHGTNASLFLFPQ